MLPLRKMPRASFALLAVSLACAGSAALVMRAYAQRLETTRPDGGPSVSVVTAAHDLNRGTTIVADGLEVRSMPSRFVPPGALRDPARAIGRIVVADVAEGEVLTGLRLTGGDAGRIASLVPPGMRAVQLPVVTGVGVQPGDLIDVLATFGGSGAHTELAGANIEVLAIERGVGGPLGEGTSGLGLIVLVSPVDAERLAFAAAFGTLSIAVRGPGETMP